MTYQVIYAAFIIFCLGLFLTVATRNILKIFLGVLISYCATTMLVYVSSNPFNTNCAMVLLMLAPIVTFIGVFVISKIYKKFNTFETDKIEKIIKEEK